MLYVSPMKALAVDVERNLRAPLAGIRHAADPARACPSPTSRSASAPATPRPTSAAGSAARPPDILITTPESLFLILTRQARESLRGVETVIVDEVHAVAGTKRGAHLALSPGAARPPARAAGPADRAVARRSARSRRSPGSSAAAHDVEVVQPPSAKTIELEVVVPVEDLAELGQTTGEVSGSAAGEERRTSIWPHVEERIVDLVEAHRSTIVFANSRRLAERLCARLNEIHDGAGHRRAAAARAARCSRPRSWRSPGPPSARRAGAGPRPPRVGVARSSAA